MFEPEEWTKKTPKPRLDKKTAKLRFKTLDDVGSVNWHKHAQLCAVFECFLKGFQDEYGLKELQKIQKHPSILTRNEHEHYVMSWNAWKRSKDEWMQMLDSRIDELKSKASDQSYEEDKNINNNISLNILSEANLPLTEESSNSLKSDQSLDFLPLTQNGEKSYIKTLFTTHAKELREFKNFSDLDDEKQRWILSRIHYLKNHGIDYLQFNMNLKQAESLFDQVKRVESEIGLWQLQGTPAEVKAKLSEYHQFKILLDEPVWSLFKHFFKKYYNHRKAAMDKINWEGWGEE